MLKLLIVDRSCAFAKRLTQELSETFEIRVCKTGIEALEEYHAFSPDMIVLEMEIPELDGMGVLRTLKSAGAQVPVLVTSTSLQSSYTQRSLAELGVEYAVSKPCPVHAVVSRLQEMVCILFNEAWSLDDRATNLLLHLGFSANGTAFRATHDALCMLSEDRTLFLTKEIYVELGKRYGSTKEAVERAIRCAIGKAWRNRQEQIWRCFFAPGSGGYVERPSNSVFLHRLALSLGNKKIV